MDEILIHNWNSKVRVNDVVFHAGDMCFAKTKQEVDVILNRLNGMIYLIPGNHDNVSFLNHPKVKILPLIHKISMFGQKIILSHYALRVWENSHHGSFSLWGHSHGNLSDDPHSLSIDIGVDCHNYFPISFEEVKAIMAKKYWRPIITDGEHQESGGNGLSKEEYAKKERFQKYQQLKMEFEQK